MVEHFAPHKVFQAKAEVTHKSTRYSNAEDQAKEVLRRRERRKAQKGTVAKLKQRILDLELQQIQN